MEIKELIKTVRMSRRGIESLVEKGVITGVRKKKGRGDPVDYNINEIKTTLGIPKERFGERLLTSKEADVILKAAGIRYVQRGNEYNTLSADMSAKGLIDSYSFSRGSRQGTKILFLEGDINALIAGNGGLLYKSRIDVIEKMIPFLAGYAGDNKDLALRWLEGESVKDMTEEYKNWTVGERVMKFKESIGNILLDRIGRLERLEELIKENEMLKGRIVDLECLYKGMQVRVTDKLSRPVPEVKISDLEVGVRNWRVCRDRGIITVADLIAYGSGKYKKIQDIGIKAFETLDEEMRSLGVKW